MARSGNPTADCYPDRVRVLVLTYETPAYPAGGGASRMHSLLEPLAERHEIRVVSTGGAPLVGSPPLNVELRLLDPGPPLGEPSGGWLHKNLNHYINGEPWLHRLAGHHNEALAAALPRELDDFRPELVHIEHGELAGLVGRIPSPLPAVLALQNMLLVVQLQQFGRTSKWESVKALLEAPILLRADRRAMNAAAATIVVSPHDQKVARRLAPRANVVLVPNCINVSYFAQQMPPDSRPCVIFSGSLHYPPNQEALRDLVERIFPRVLRQVPDAQLVVVGRSAPDWLQRLVVGRPGVQMVGEVPDVRPELWRAWVSVAPLSSGSGTPLKVMEAMAAGVPVVTTPRVARALEVGRADGVIAAGLYEEFADRLVDVLRDDVLREELSRRAVSSATARFDRRPAALRQEAAWLEAAR